MAKTVVLDCPCVNNTTIIVKSAGQKKPLCPTAEIPWMNRENGARYQDAKYGKGKRLHNLNEKPKGNTANCSVCGKVKFV